MLKLRLIDLKAISSDSLTQKGLFPSDYFNAQSYKIFLIKKKVNKERETFKKSKAGSFPKGGL